MIEFLSQPWPWYVAGPLIGLTLTLLLFVGGRRFGISSSLQHVCAAAVPGKSAYLRYDWRQKGTWNLLLVVGILIGGGVSGLFLSTGEPIALSEATVQDLDALGVALEPGLVPTSIYSLEAAATPAGFLLLVGGGFLVGFGARYANGCTSGHGVTGLANFELSALVSVLAFFAGGLIATHLLLPLIL